jgi:hypothetical protein
LNNQKLTHLTHELNPQIFIAYYLSVVPPKADSKTRGKRDREGKNSSGCPWKQVSSVMPLEVKVGGRKLREAAVQNSDWPPPLLR